MCYKFSASDYPFILKLQGKANLRGGGIVNRVELFGMALVAKHGGKGSYPLITQTLGQHLNN
jgi:hypothetical protein